MQYCQARKMWYRAACRSSVARRHPPVRRLIHPAASHQRQPSPTWFSENRTLGVRRLDEVLDSSSRDLLWLGRPRKGVTQISKAASSRRIPQAASPLRVKTAERILDVRPPSNGTSHKTPFPTRVFHETDALHNQNEKLSMSTARSAVFQCSLHRSA